MRIKALLTTFLLISIFTLARGDSSGLNNGLKFLADYQKNPDGTITFTLTIQNAGPKTLDLVSLSSQIYDIEVYQEAGILIWKWANDRSFLTVITTIILEPAQTRVFQETWQVQTNQGHPVPPGTYKVRAQLVTRINRGHKQVSPFFPLFFIYCFSRWLHRRLKLADIEPEKKIKLLKKLPLLLFKDRLAPRSHLLQNHFP